MNKMKRKYGINAQEDTESLDGVYIDIIQQLIGSSPL